MDIRDKLSQWKAWHEEGIDNIMEWFGWDYYEMLWIAWAEWLILGLLLWWIF